MKKPTMEMSRVKQVAAAMALAAGSLMFAPCSTAQNIAAGPYHTLVIGSDGQTVGWGRNDVGQLADNTTTTRRATPAVIYGTNRFLKIASGGDYSDPGHVLGIERDGSVWSWGYNLYGQTGQGGNPVLAPGKITGLSNAVDVAVGALHSLVLQSDGKVWAFGYNASGELGNGTTTSSSTPVQATGLSNIVAIAAGDYHSLALRSDGSVFCWGYGDYGQLGDGASVTRLTPVAVTNLSNVVSISGTVYYSSLAVLADGSVRAWGLNYYGIFGNGNSTSSPVPVTSLVSNVVKLSATYHVVALRTDGSVWGWGYNGFGELGRGITSGAEPTPAPVTNLNAVMDVAAGAYHSVALKSDGSVLEWGSNGYYQLANANGDSSVPILATNVTALTSRAHLLFVKADGTVQASGCNGFGQLGDSTVNNRPAPVSPLNLGYVRSASAGRGHSLAVRWDGSVWSWGWNSGGQLGLGNNLDSYVPVKVSSLTDAMGVAAGSMHSVAVRSNGTIFAWGLNDAGQLGDGTTTSRNVPTVITNLSGIRAVAAGERHSAAINTNWNLYCWGNNCFGQLGDGTSSNRTTPVLISGLGPVTAVAAGAGHTVVIKENRTLSAFGDNRFGQLGDATTVNRSSPVAVTNLSNIIAVAAGDAHTLALKSDGTVWAWGRNTYGQLGDGTTTLRSSPVQVTNITNAILIQAQGDSSVIVLATGEALAFGANGSGQLGTGGTVSQSMPLKGGFQYFETFSPYIKNVLAQSVNHRYLPFPSTKASDMPWVSPLSYQSGVQLDMVGDNASLFPSGLPWFIGVRDTNRCVYNPTNGHYLNQDNALAAFGTRAGGSPLYSNQRYSFAIYCGYALDTNSQVRIRVFRLPAVGSPQTNLVGVATNYFTIPWRTTQPSDWQAFASNQFTTTITSFGLQTRLQVVDGFNQDTWGAAFQYQGRFDNTQFVLQHSGTSESVDYGYVIEGYGYIPKPPQYTNSNPVGATFSGTNFVAPAWVPLYAFNLDTRSGLRSQFVDAPQFDGQPLPSTFIGKSLAELLTNVPPVTTSGSLTNQSYRTVNASPELFAHPLLDKLVTDLKRDPLALSSYVLNEIELSDPVGFGPGNNSAMPAIDYPGVSRNAVGVLRERQGSAVEQCALLVYLLRQAGYGAAYAFPTNQNVKMPDTQLSKLLRMQLHGAVDYQGILYTTESLIAVNYPWVVADLGDGQLRHIFPWLKDTEVTEGLNLWDYMPAEYNSGYKWVRDYVLGKTNIMGLDAESDTVATLFPKFLDKHLRENWPGISLDDMGIRFRNRRHQIGRWEDLPRPLVVDSPTNAVVVADLISGTNAVSRLVNVFNTLQVQVRPRGQTNVLMDSGVLRLADIGSRKCLLFTNATKLRLSLTPQHEGILTINTNTSPTNFPGSSLAMTNGQVLEISTPPQTNLDGVLILARDRFVSTNETSFLGLGKLFNYTLTRPFNLDNISAVCASPGRVTRDMLQAQAEAFWQVQNRRQYDTNYVTNVEEYQGALVHLMGMKYLAKASLFRQGLQDMNKVRSLSAVKLGLSTFKQYGQGTVSGILDFNFQDDLLANASSRPDIGDASVRVYDSFHWLSIASSSSEEHAVINEYLGGTDSISTVKLLQLAQKRSTGPGTDVIELYRHNYQSYYDQIYGAETNHASWTAITNAFSGLDSDMTRVLVTPGVVTNSSGNYSGLGTLIVQPLSAQALISGTYNGGAGPRVPNLLEKALNLIAELSIIPMEVAAKGIELAIGPREAVDLPPDKPMTPQQALAASKAAAEAQARKQNPNQMYAAFVYQMIVDSGAANKQGERQNETSVFDPVDVINGYFYADAADLNLPGPMPITARRNYSSQNVYPSQFGYAWKLNYFPYLTFITNQNDTVNIRATEASGACLEYSPSDGTSTNLWLASATDNQSATHNNNEGAKNQNLLFGTRIEQVVTNGQTYYYQKYPDGSLKTYQVRSDFRISSTSNSLARIRPYLMRWDDSRGNNLSFTYGTSTNKCDYGEIYRIDSSSGVYLGFNYDEAGRVVEAYSGDGRRLAYEYDKYGDLVTVTLPDASQVRYEYEHYSFNYTTTNAGVITTNTALDSRHLLVREVKPDGRLLVNEYDGERRVVKQSATAGQDLRLIQNATFVYSNNFYFTNAFSNSISGTTFVIDVFNNTNRYDYTNGSLTKITDPLGYALIQDWYWTNTTAGSYTKALKSRTDKRGLTMTFLYDTNGNVVTNIVSGADLTGNGLTNATNIATYVSGNLLESQTDAMGNTLKLRYADTNYPTLPTQMERYAGASTPIATNRLTYTNAVTVFTNGGTAYTNKAFGLLAKEISAWATSDEATTDYAYDGRGFVVQKLRYTGTGDPNVTNFFTYNDRGELVEQRDAAGRKMRLAYDPRGNPEYTEKFDENGNRLYWEYAYYNENGELTWSDGPRFDPEDYVWRDYDGMGRKTQEIRWRSRAKANGTGVEAEEGYSLFATTFSEYDTFGNLLRVIDPYGNYARMMYDANGQMLSKSRYAVSNAVPLATEWFGYEGGGLLAAHTNALGGVTKKFYTTTGKLRRQENADGSTNGVVYRLDGRLATNYLTSGAYWETQYDDANRKVTRTFRTATGTYLAQEIEEFDRRGNLIRKTDAGTNVFTTTYDGLNRVKTSAGPTTIAGVSGQQMNTVYYDAAGIFATNKNGLGELTISKTDALGRPVRSEVRDATGYLLRVNKTSYATNHHSVTSTTGETSTPISTTTYTDTFGQPVLNVFADGKFTLNRYDMAGNLVSSQDELAQVTQFAYDPFYRVQRKATPDGAFVTFGYNAGGSLTNRTMPGGLVWSAGYDSAGRMVSEVLNGGGLTARNFSFSYFGAGHTNAGLLQTVTDPLNVTHTSAYDAFLRTASQVSAGTNTVQNQTNTFTYDTLGRVLALDQGTGGGTTTRVERGFDGYGQLTNETVKVAGTNFSQFTQAWTSAGRRSALVSQIGGTNGSLAFSHYADGLLASMSQGGVLNVYDYDDRGLMLSRTNQWRRWQVNGRDARGRPTNEVAMVSGATALAETLAWRDNSTLLSYGATRAGLGAWNETNQFAYNNRGQLTQESFNPRTGLNATNAFGFPSGTNNQGVRTSATLTGGLTASWTGTSDGLGRVKTESVGALTKWLTQARGYAVGAETVRTWLDNTELTGVMFGSVPSTGLWLADLTLTNTGSHTLRATAYHPLSRTNANTTNTFTVVDGSGSVTNTYDAAGNVVGRQLPGGRTQALVWDGGGRLVSATERDASNNGWNWSALYDGLGRRLRTVHAPVVSGITNGQPTTTDAWFDPQVEFLEVAVGVNGVRTWAIHGPDLSGRYGGAQGIGGLEGTIRESDGTKRGAVSDHFGNVVASIAGLELAWNGTRVTGYGPVPGQPVPWLGAGKELTEVSVWRSRRLDPTGFYWLGARYYEPGAGRFLSPDPFGHEASMSLYDYANGDPVNYLDPDGRDGILQSLFPATSIAGGGRPMTGSARGDIQFATQYTYPMHRTGILGANAALMGIGGSVGGFQSGAVASGVLAATRSTASMLAAQYVPTISAREAVRLGVIGAGVNGVASGVVANMTGQPVGPAVAGGVVSGSMTGIGAGAVMQSGNALAQAAAQLFTIGVGAGVIGDTVSQVSQNGLANVSMQQQMIAGGISGVATVGQGAAQALGNTLASSAESLQNSLVQRTSDMIMMGAGDDAVIAVARALSEARNSAAMTSLALKAAGEYAVPFAESGANALVQSQLTSTTPPVEGSSNSGPLGKK